MLIIVRYKMPNGKVVERPFEGDLESVLFQLAKRQCSYITWWPYDPQHTKDQLFA